jgi:ATP-dependent exoDNAse (exonuclease V) beta subunit
LLALDAANRQRAIDPSCSFIVEAPAGAGKTELLTQRFLALLRQVEEPEQIVALTFTHKAAAEMRERIVGSLEQAALGRPPPEAHRQRTYELGQQVLQHERQRQWGLLQQPARLRITTLDALCGQLARQMPLLSRLGSQPGIAADAQPHYRRAAQETLRLLDADGPLADCLERVLERFDHQPARLGELLQAMLARREAWLALCQSGADLQQAETALRDLIDDELRRLVALLPAGWQAALQPAARWAAAHALQKGSAATSASAPASATQPPQTPQTPLQAVADWQQPLRGCSTELPMWRGLAELLLTQKGGPRQKIPAAYGLNGAGHKALAAAFKSGLEALPEAALAALARVRCLPDPRYGASDRAFIADLLAVLKVAAAQLWLVFQQAREVDFAEIALQALHALGRAEEPSDLQLQLDHRISHLLIDEFQDTSPLQVELLRRLTAGWQTGDGRTLFLVGDPMQSIYRFRKAEVGLFLQVRAHGLGAIQPQPLHLYRNNRSQPPLVHWVNQTFAHVFGPDDDHRRGAVRFAPASPTHTGHPQARVQWHPLIENRARSAQADEGEGEPQPDDAPASSAEREAQQVLALIAQARADDPDGRIAVLVRARRHLEALVPALRALPQRLAFQAVEIEALAERQPIQDLLILTRALHHLADRVHWLALLRAPWCGLTLADLHLLAADAPHRSVWHLLQDGARCARLSADGQQRLAHLREVLGLALAHQGQQRPRRWVEGVWQALGGPLTLAQEADLSDTQAYFEVLERCTRHGVLELERIETELERLYAAPDPDGAALQLMTLHKAKGLEFDTVILPGLQRKAQGADRALLLWDQVLDDQGHERLLLATPPEAGHDGASIYDYLLTLENERQRNEAKRLLYVGATRARRQLHLLGSASPNSRGDALCTPAPDSLLALLWPVAESAFQRAWRSNQPPSGAEADAGEGADADADADVEVEAGAGADGAAGVEAATTSPPARPTLAEYAHRLQRLARPGWPAALAHPGTPLPTAGPDLAPAPQPPAPEALTATTTAQRTAPASPAAAAAIGTLVHRYLELIAHDGLEAWPTTRLPTLHGAMQQWLRALGLSAPEATAAADRVQQHLHTTLNSADGRWLLAAHTDAASECALGSFADLTPAQPPGSGQRPHPLHVIDRTFVHQGRRWIVDYKTRAHDPSAPSNGELEGWRAQLQRYRALYDDALPVQLAVFLTHSGRLLRLADD